MESVVAGLNTAVTPLGRPDAVRFTLPLNPFWSFTLMVLLALAPARRARLPADDERLNFAGAVTVSMTAVVLLRAPEVPVTIMVWDPGTAVVLTAKISELWEEVVAGLNVAVTPLGTSDAAKATLLLKPF